MVSHKSDDYKTTSVKYYLVEDATQVIFNCSQFIIFTFMVSHIKYIIIITEL